MERNINGIIQKWETKIGTKKDGDKFFQAVATIDAKEYRFFCTSEMMADSDFIKKYPIGTIVEFVQTKSSEQDKYWNYKANSITSKGAAKPAVVQEALKNITSDQYWRNKEQREIDNEPIWQYLKCLDATSQMVKIDLTKSHEDVTTQTKAVLSIAKALFMSVVELKTKQREAKEIMNKLKADTEFEFSDDYGLTED